MSNCSCVSYLCRALLHLLFNLHNKMKRSRPPKHRIPRQPPPPPHLSIALTTKTLFFKHFSNPPHTHHLIVFPWATGNLIKLFERETHSLKKKITVKESQCWSSRLDSPCAVYTELKVILKSSAEIFLTHCVLFFSSFFSCMKHYLLCSNRKHKLCTFLWFSVTC